MQIIPAVLIVDKTLPKTLLGFVMHFLRKNALLAISGSLMSLAYAFDQTLMPVLFGKIIDIFTHYNGDRSLAWATLKTPVTLLIVFWLLIEVGFRSAGFIAGVLFPRLEAQMRISIFSYVHNHSHHYFANNFAGNLANKISDLPESVSRCLQLLMWLIIPAFIAVLITVVVFYRVNPFFCWIILAWLSLHLSFCLYFSVHSSQYSYIHSEARSQLNGKIVDSLTNYLSVKLFSNKLAELDYVKIYQKDEQLKNQKQLFFIERCKIVLGLLTIIGSTFGINGYAFYCWKNNLISVGDVVIIFNTSWNLTMMMWWLGLELPNFFKDIGVAAQGFAILEQEPEIQNIPCAKDLVVTAGKIEFNNVYFRYNKADPLFYKQSVIINPSQKVGLVGYSGSGKTTFVQLILRLFDIQEGSITIDGQNIAHVTQESLRKNIAIIPQDPVLFHRSIMENIRYARLDATDEEVIEAAKQAHAHEFIIKMANGYDAMVGERGVKLSGGQRQRIAIARAILKNAPILILDEATSALDSVTENYIQESLTHLMQNKTVIVIAHRLSTLLNMDRIIVFDKGKIVEDGTQEQLLNNRGIFCHLWDAQVGGFITE
jgi:ATP-binding cassette subfamily B protein